MVIRTSHLQCVQEGFAGSSANDVSGKSRSPGRNPECACSEDIFSSGDPLTGLMMRADRVAEGDLQAILEEVATARGFKSLR